MQLISKKEALYSCDTNMIYYRHTATLSYCNGQEIWLP